MFLIVYIILLLCIITHTNAILKLNGGTIEEFKKEIGEGYWLVDFYAPWCGHCKKLEPLLNEVEKEVLNLSTSIKIGKIDATANSDIAKEYNVKSFPTIFFINIETNLLVKYEGSRTKDGFLALMNKLTSTPLITITDTNDIINYPKASVFFILSLPSNGNSNNIKENFEAVAKKHHATCYFAILTNNDVNNVIISKIEVGRGININRVMSNSDKASIDDIEEFVHHHNHPLITNLENHNFKTLGSKNKTMIINIINSKEKPDGLSQQGFDAFQSAVEMLSPDIIDRFIFCTLDLVKYRRFLKMYNSANVANILFLDYGEDYYSSLEHHSKTKKWINADDIKNLIIEVVIDKKVKMNLYQKPGMLRNITNKFKSYYPYSLLCFIPIILLLIAIFYPAPDRKQKKKKENKDI